MAAIYGVFSRGEPLQAPSVDPVRREIANLPHQAKFDWQDSKAAIGGVTIEESPRNCGISLREQGVSTIAVVAYARIDNRDELADRLSLPRSQVAGMDSSELILLAYLQWSADCPSYLLGDFAFAVVDKDKLLIARDPLGIRPLYLARVGDMVVFSTDVRTVVAHPGVSADLSQDALLEYLVCGGLYGQRLTVYGDVQKLPAATMCDIRFDSQREQRYWDPETIEPLSLSDDQAIDQVRALLKDAVRVRIPPDVPFASHLSGGMDSSLVTALAASLIEDRTRMSAWTWMPAPISAEEEAGPEWSRARQVAEQWGVTLHHARFDAGDLEKILRSMPLLDNDSAGLWYEFNIRERLAANGAGVMLSGWGGDQFISNAGDLAYIEQILSGRLWPLVEMARTARDSQKPTRAFLSQVKRLLGWPVQAYLKALTKRKPFGIWGDQAKVFLSAEAWSRVSGYVGRFPQRRPRLSIRGWQIEDLRWGGHLARVESWAGSGARAGVEYRYPLLDQRVVELAIGLPGRLYLGEGMRRYAMAEACSTILPGQLIFESIKREPRRISHGMEVIAPVVAHRVAQLQDCHGSLVDSQALKRVVSELPENTADYSENQIRTLMLALRASITGGVGTTSLPDTLI